MRIAGYIQHPNMKITIFHYDGRYSLKFETPQFEQTFKLSIDLYPDIQTIHTLVDDQFLQGVETGFQNMSDQMRAKVQKSDSGEEDIFPHIV
jgi:hypothetical protein